MIIKLSLSGNYLMAEISIKESLPRLNLFPILSSYISTKYATPTFDGKEYDDAREQAREDYATGVAELTMSFKKEIKSLQEAFNSASEKKDFKEMKSLTAKMDGVTLNYNKAIIDLQNQLAENIEQQNINEKEAKNKTPIVELKFVEIIKGKNTLSIPIEVLNAGNVQDPKGIAFNLETLMAFLTHNTGGEQREYHTPIQGMPISGEPLNGKRLTGAPLAQAPTELQREYLAGAPLSGAMPIAVEEAE